MKKIIISIFFLCIIILTKSVYAYETIFIPQVISPSDNSFLMYSTMNEATIKLANGFTVHHAKVTGETQIRNELIVEDIQVVLFIDVSKSMQRY